MPYLYGGFGRHGKVIAAIVSNAVVVVSEAKRCGFVICSFFELLVRAGLDVFVQYLHVLVSVGTTLCICIRRTQHH